MENISKHITYKEAVRSSTAIRKGISNEPTKEQIDNMKKVANEVFEKARVFFNEPIFVTSFFRSTTLNHYIGGSITSDHCGGFAIDMRFSHHSQRSNAELFYFIYNHCDFKQLIWEFGNDSAPDWVHVSYQEGNNKKEVLKAYRENNKTYYAIFK